MGPAEAQELLLDQLVHDLKPDPDGELKQPLAQVAGEARYLEPDLPGEIELGSLVCGCGPSTVVVPDCGSPLVGSPPRSLSAAGMTEDRP